MNLKATLTRKHDFEYCIDVASDGKDDNIFDGIEEHCMESFSNSELEIICKQVNEQLAKVEATPQLLKFLEALNKVLVKRNVLQNKENALEFRQ